jgi:hypothetical protein
MEFEGGQTQANRTQMDYVMSSNVARKEVYLCNKGMERNGGQWGPKNIREAK